MGNLRKVLLSLGAVAAIAALATGGTFAVFTAEDSIGANNIDSGSVEIDLSDGPVIDVSDMVIGDSETGSITITNTGDNKAAYTLTGEVAAGGSALLEGAVDITIDDADLDTGLSNTELVSDTLANFNGSDGIVVVLAPNETQTYDVEVELTSYDDGTANNGNDDNQLEDRALVETFNVDGVQRTGEDRTDDATDDPEAIDGAENDPVYTP